MTRPVFLLPVLALLLADICYTASTPNPNPGLSEKVKTRSFCNYYGGCSSYGKRSPNAVGMLDQELMRPPQFPNSNPRLSEVLMKTKKGLFCNDFAGCRSYGKRVQNAPGMLDQELMRPMQYIVDSLPILELDNGIEELSRQILSEAKLWEAIQVASAEIAKAEAE